MQSVFDTPLEATKLHFGWHKELINKSRKNKRRRKKSEYKVSCIKMKEFRSVLNDEY